MAGKKEAGYDVVRRDLKEGTLQKVYIFYGEEQYLLRTYLNQVRKAVVPQGFEEFNYHRLAGKGLSPLVLQETVEAMPMMAQSTLVEVTDMDIFRLDEEGRQQLTALLEDFPDYCTLVFIYDTIEYKRNAVMKKLCAAISAHAVEVEFCRQENRALYRWIQQHFAAAGHDIDSATMEHLLFTCGTMMTNLAPEIDKIAAYAKDTRITVADINAVADPVLDARVFDMTNCITAGKYDDAARVLGDLLRMQEEPIAILSVIGRELRRIYTARLALDGGKDRMWLKETWHMSSDYPAKLLMAAAAKVDRKWCADAVRKAEILDRRMKSERNMDAAQELKLFLMELAGTR